MQKNSQLVPGIVLAAGISLSGFFVGKGISNIHQFDQYVSVKGLAEKAVKADKVIWKLSYTVHGSSIKQMYQQLTLDQNAIVEFLESANIAKNSIQIGSTSVNMNADRENGSKGGNIVSYTGYSEITVVTDQVDLVQELSQKTDQLIAKDVVINASNLKYQYTNLNAVKPEMLNLATANAKIAAENFAKQSGAEVGKIRQASQGLFEIKNSDESYGDQDANKTIRVVVNMQYFIG